MYVNILFGGPERGGGGGGGGGRNLAVWRETFPSLPLAMATHTECLLQLHWTLIRAGREKLPWQSIKVGSFFTFYLGLTPAATMEVSLL